MEEEEGEDCWEEDSCGGGTEGEDGGEDDGYRKEGPAEISDAVRRQTRNEAEGFGEETVEGDAFDAIVTCTGEIGVGTGELDDAAAAFLVADHAGVDSCLANKRIRAVNVVGNTLSGLIFRRAADYERLVVDFLSSHRMRRKDMNGFTIGRTPECEVGIVEWTTSIAVQTTLVPTCPVACSTPDWLGFTVTLDISGRG